MEGSAIQLDVTPLHAVVVFHFLNALKYRIHDTIFTQVCRPKCSGKKDKHLMSTEDAPEIVHSRYAAEYCSFPGYVSRCGLEASSPYALYHPRTPGPFSGDQNP